MLFRSTVDVIVRNFLCILEAQPSPVDFGSLGSISIFGFDHCRCVRATLVRFSRSRNLQRLRFSGNTFAANKEEARSSPGGR